MRNKIHLYNGFDWARFDGLYSINLKVFGFEFTFLWRKYNREKSHA